MTCRSDSEQAIALRTAHVGARFVALLTEEYRRFPARAGMVPQWAKLNYLRDLDRMQEAGSNARGSGTNSYPLSARVWL